MKLQNPAFWNKHFSANKIMSKSEFLFFLNAWHSYAWKLYRLFFISTFSMIIWDTLVQIIAHNSNNKYGFQAKDWVQNFLHTLLDLIDLTDLNHLNNLFDLIDLANYSKSKEWNDWNDWNEWIGMKWLKILNWLDEKNKKLSEKSGVVSEDIY